MNGRYDWSIDSLIAQNFYDAVNKEKVRQVILKQHHGANKKVSYYTELLRGFFK